MTVTADASGTWQLGDLTVNRMGLGAMRLPAAPDRAQAIAVLRRAVDLGVNHIDTAQFYFSPRRSANELINSALAPYPDDLVITTKVWPARDPSGEWWWASPGQLRGQVEENLRQLGRDYLDVVNLRIPGSKTDESIAEHFAVMAGLQKEGLIRHLGISSVKPAHLAEVQAIAPVVCVQNRYGIDDAGDDLLDICGQQGIAFVPFFAIAGERNAAGGAADPTGPVLAVARTHNATPAQIRLAWTLHRGPHVLAIPGTGDPGHLTDNIAAAALRLSPDELTVLSGRPAG
jgi:pyridoxine 4-dehydrogenase